MRGVFVVVAVFIIQPCYLVLSSNQQCYGNTYGRLLEMKTLRAHKPT